MMINTNPANLTYNMTQSNPPQLSHPTSLLVSHTTPSPFPPDSAAFSSPPQFAAQEVVNHDYAMGEATSSFHGGGNTLADLAASISSLAARMDGAMD